MPWKVNSSIMIGDPALIYDTGYYFIKVYAARSGTWDSEETHDNVLYVYHQDVKNPLNLSWKEVENLEVESGMITAFDADPVLQKNKESKFRYVGDLTEDDSDFVEFEHGIILNVGTDGESVFYPVFFSMKDKEVVAIKVDFSQGRDPDSDSNPEM